MTSLSPPPPPKLSIALAVSSWALFSATSRANSTVDLREIYGSNH